MKPIILYIPEDTEGKITLTKEEFEKMITDAYNEGYADGHKQGLAFVPPSQSPHIDPYLGPVIYTTNHTDPLTYKDALNYVRADWTGSDPCRNKETTTS